jgi:hypothetical protein
MRFVRDHDRHLRSIVNSLETASIETVRVDRARHTTLASIAKSPNQKGIENAANII